MQTQVRIPLLHGALTLAILFQPSISGKRSKRTGASYPVLGSEIPGLNPSDWPREIRRRHFSDGYAMFSK